MDNWRFGNEKQNNGDYIKVSLLTGSFGRGKQSEMFELAFMTSGGRFSCKQQFSANQSIYKRLNKVSKGEKIRNRYNPGLLITQFWG